jgi:hypothetical protein
VFNALSIKLQAKVRLEGYDDILRLNQSKIKQEYF